MKINEKKIEMNEKIIKIGKMKNKINFSKSKKQ